MNSTDIREGVLRNDGGQPIAEKGAVGSDIGAALAAQIVIV